MQSCLHFSQKPVGQITRGKTARNRLRRVDIFLSMYASPLIREPDSSYYVDLGYGAEAFTVLESARHLRKFNPNLPILGVEIDQERVENALPYRTALTHFRKGGFNVPLLAGESVRIMRTFNVLRQYEEGEVLPSWQSMAAVLNPGGLIIEGTSDPFGKRWVANLLRVRVQPGGQRQLIWEGLLFSTNFHDGFTPEMFQPVLPKNLIHRMVPGEPIYRFFEDWKTAAGQQMGMQSYGIRQWFSGTARALAHMGYPLLIQKKYLNQGFLLLKLNQPISDFSSQSFFPN
jgi:hypothetical protein